MAKTVKSLTPSCWGGIFCPPQDTRLGLRLPSSAFPWPPRLCPENDSLRNFSMLAGLHSVLSLASERLVPPMHRRDVMTYLLNYYVLVLGWYFCCYSLLRAWRSFLCTLWTGYLTIFKTICCSLKLIICAWVTNVYWFTTSENLDYDWQCYCSVLG